MSVTEVTRDNFENEVIKSDKKVLLDFWAAWCGPCSMMSPVIDDVAKERSDIKVGKVNIDEQGELADKFGIQSIPTLVVIENGKTVNKSIGVISKASVNELL